MTLFYTDQNGNRTPLGTMYQGSNFVYLSRLNKIVDFENILDEIDTFTAQDFADLGIEASQENVLRAAVVAYKKSNDFFKNQTPAKGDIDNDLLSQHYDWGFFENTALRLNPFSKPHFVRENALTTVEIGELDEDTGEVTEIKRRPMLFDRQGAFFAQTIKEAQARRPTLYFSLFTFTFKFIY